MTTRLTVTHEMSTPRESRIKHINAVFRLRIVETAAMTLFIN
jgi:hypothetical protein